MIPAAAEASAWAFKASAGDAAASPAKTGAQPQKPLVHLKLDELPASTSARSAWGDSPVGARILAWRGEEKEPPTGRTGGDEDAAPAPAPVAGPSKETGMRPFPAAAALHTPTTSSATPSPPDDARECWTFSCSGWLFVYTFGVVKALKELGMHRNIHAIGTSGGACAASYLFFGDDPADVDRTVAYIQECAVFARSHWRHPFQILACLEGAMDRFFQAGGDKKAPAAPSDDTATTLGLGPAASAALAGNLEVSVTTLPFLRNRRVRDFKGPAELKAAMLASACAMSPPVWLPQLKAWCIDGCVSDVRVLRGLLLGRRYTLLHQLSDAVSVSPFYASRACIRPSTFVPPWWGAYPPKPAQLEWLFKLGHRDALAWLDKSGKLPEGALADSAGDDADHPPGPDAAGWREVLWEVRHLEGRAAALAGRKARGGGRAGTAASTSATSPIAPTAPALPSLVRHAVWAVIALELAASLCACALAVLVGPLLRDGVPPGDAARRWAGAVRGVVGLALAACVERKGALSAPASEATLREHSAVWRWLRFCLR